MATTKTKSKAKTSRSAGTHSRSTTRKSTSPKPSTKRKYSLEAGSYVEEEMKEMKQGKLKSGRSGQTVHNPKQAIAIGLSKARKAGKKVPSNPHKKAA